jgi:hypothetical protein
LKFPQQQKPHLSATITIKQEKKRKKKTKETKLIKNAWQQKHLRSPRRIYYQTEIKSHFVSRCSCDCHVHTVDDDDNKEQVRERETAEDIADIRKEDERGEELIIEKNGGKNPPKQISCHFERHG